MKAGTREAEHAGMDRNVERAGKGEQGDERQHEKGID